MADRLVAFDTMSAENSDDVRDVSPDATPFDIADRIALLKQQESDIRKRRWALEQRLAETLSFHEGLAKAGKDSGSKTFTLQDEDGISMKVRLAQEMSHNIDQRELASVATSFEERDVEMPIKYKPELVASLMSQLKLHYPDLHRTFQRAVVTTPRKLSVTLVK